MKSIVRSVAAFGLALAFTQATVFAQQQYQYPPAVPQAAPSPVQPQYPPPQEQYQYPPPQVQYQYPPPQEQYQYPPPQEQYQYLQPMQPIEQPVEPATNAAKDRKNFAAMDVFPLFKGLIASTGDFLDISISLAYERLMAPHLSLGPNLEMYFMSYDRDDFIHFYFSLAAEGRYYTDADFDKFFFGTTLGFNLLAVDGEVGSKYGGFFGLTTSFKMGYKLMLSESLYIEPSLSWFLSKSGAPVPTPSGWKGGQRIGYFF